MKKKIILIAVCAFFIFLLIFSFIIKDENAERAEVFQTESGIESGTEETSDTQLPEKNAVEFFDFEKLESYIEADEVKKIMEKIPAFISQDEAYCAVKKIICQDVIDKENTLEFYCLLDQIDGVVLYGRYDKDDHDLLQWIDEISLADAENKWKEKKAEVISTEEWEEEKQLPREWDYVEEDPRPVEVRNWQEVAEVIGEDNLYLFETELLTFLQENEEYRREVTIDKDSVKRDETSVEFLADFQTARLDQKRIYAVLENGHYAISFWEGGA